MLQRGRIHFISDLQCKDQVYDLAAVSDHSPTMINADVRIKDSRAQQVTIPEIGS
jgi:hypothetical protein